MYKTLEIEYQANRATIWMNRPTVLNAFDEVLILELDKAFAQLAADDSVRIVVLAGRGKHFSAGADLNWMKRAANYTVEQNLEDARTLASMLRHISEMKKPTIARVQGAALGGGTGLTAACDMAVAADNAIFATSEVKFGIIPSAISPFVLRAIGKRQALRYFQSGERFNAQEAHRIGLVHEVTDIDNLDNLLDSLCTSLLQGGPTAQIAAKSLIHVIANCPISESITEETAQRIAKQRATDEAKEGFNAFFDKRPASWCK